MRIIMMGTGPFAVPTFQALCESERHEVATLVTRPDSGSSRRKNVTTNPMRDAAIALGVPVISPPNINSADAISDLESQNADLMVVCDYGQILSADALKATPMGGINLHGSLLPKYRGAAPIHWALYHGERETGVSVIHMTPGLDAGPILTSLATPIGPDEDQIGLESRLSILGKDAVMKALQVLADWNQSDSIGAPQDKRLATKAPRLARANGLIDWRRTSKQIFDQVRAFKPWPATFTFLPTTSGPPVRATIVSVSVVDLASIPDLDPQIARKPATIVAVDKKRLIVATGDGALAIDRLQPAGKREMESAEFLRGHRLLSGQALLSSADNG